MSSLVVRVGTPVAAALGLGITASGYFAFANYGASKFGILPAVVPGHDKVNVEAGKAVELWAFFYQRAAVHFVSASLTASTSYLVAGYLYSGSARHVKSLLFSASALMIGVLPWTVITMMPLNHELLATRDSVYPSGRELTIDEAEASWGRLGKWTRLHLVRMACGFASYSLGLAALVQV
ncbi:hypothetical protein BD626DRAFT_460754 [Schizophyllum amplum]|uniref:DUF1772-domain-containing protein n=1 Tax=Schizophyllum amplum TaxID=97359 RepID=A0A550C7R4_9AGAR|nr:hypothetical protein BD626DRAFT_460754 [Auriculariopsis ampla]